MRCHQGYRLCLGRTKLSKRFSGCIAPEYFRPLNLECSATNVDESPVKFLETYIDEPYVPRNKHQIGPVPKYRNQGQQQQDDKQEMTIRSHKAV